MYPLKPFQVPQHLSMNLKELLDCSRVLQRFVIAASRAAQVVASPYLGRSPRGLEYYLPKFIHPITPCKTTGLGGLKLRCNHSAGASISAG